MSEPSDLPVVGPTSKDQELTILHFNDVYHISDANLVARFASVLENPSIVTGGDPSGGGGGGPSLRVFSGDAFSPSLEAAVLRGKHMAPVLDSLGIDVACYGNHDFDFGETRLVDLASQMSFPWTLANAVADCGPGRETRLLAGAREYVVKDFEGYKIGFFGLAGTDWPSNCQHLPDCTILDPTAVARRVASHLRLSQGCDFVIAITHMRLVEDLAVGDNTISGNARVDLVLGGHDHHVLRRTAGDANPNPDLGFHDDGACVTDYEGLVRIIKSGTDWRGLSLVQLRLSRASNGTATASNMSVKQISDLERLPNYNEIPPSSRVLDILHATHNEIEKSVMQPVLHADVPLEGRTRLVRSRETNLGNMLADAVRAFYATDIALVNSGAIRCDCVVGCVDGSPLRVRDIIEITPFGNALVVKRVNGHVLAEALENSVSDAHTDGRFLHLSGLSIALDWRRPEGRRVRNISCNPSEGPRRPLESGAVYTVAMADFIGSGFDGYACFQAAETLVDAGGAITDTDMLLEIFKTGSEDMAQTEIDDGHTDGINRAKKAVICRYHEADRLPVVRPMLENRIKVISDSDL